MTNKKFLPNNNNNSEYYVLSPQVISRHEIDAFASSIVATLQQFEFMDNGRKKLDVFLLGLNYKYDKSSVKNRFENITL